MEACWAHNPEVRRSKLRSARILRQNWNWWKIDCVLKTIQVELSPTVCAGFLLTRNTLHKSHLVATFDNTSYTQKYKCRGSGFQSPKYWQKFKLVKNVLCHQNKQCVQYFELENVYSIVYSQAVTHPSTNTTQRCLTSVIGRELVYSRWYGRRQYFWISPLHVLKHFHFQVVKCQLLEHMW